MARGIGDKRIASISEIPGNRERVYWKEMMAMLKAMIDKLTYAGRGHTRDTRPQAALHFLAR